MSARTVLQLSLIAAIGLAIATTVWAEAPAVDGAIVDSAPLSGNNLATTGAESRTSGPALDYWSMVFVFLLATFIGLGVIRRVSRLLYTPLMSLTNAISAIAVVGAILVTGGEDHPLPIRIMGAVALFASMTNIVSGFLITNRMLGMFKTNRPSDGGHA